MYDSNDDAPVNERVERKEKPEPTPGASEDGAGLPEVYRAELQALKQRDAGIEISRSASGRYYALINIPAAHTWNFMVFYDLRFPDSDKPGGVPIKPVLLYPTLNKIPALAELEAFPYSVFDDDLNSEYLFSETIYKAVTRRFGKTDQPLSEILYDSLLKWVRMIENADTSAKELDALLNGWADIAKKHRFTVPARRTPKLGLGKKYNSEERSARGHPQCKKIVLSRRAYAAIYSETQRRITTETGGIFMGHYKNGVWYIIEATDPGINAVFSGSYHEGDEKYYNNVLRAVSRLYRHKLELLGMWHRHPGSLDRFSGTDDDTNGKYAEVVGNGAISALVNIDPEFRLTFYYAVMQNGGVTYYKTDYEVSDDYGDMAKFREIASQEDINRQINNRS